MTLQNQVLGQVHMLQHQVGMATRVALARFESLIDENAVLARALAAAQGRSLQQAAGSAQRIDALEADLVRQRAVAVARQTDLAQQRELLATLDAAVPHLRDRQALTAEVGTLRDRVQDLQRELTAVRDQLQRQRLRAQVAADTPAGVSAGVATGAACLSKPPAGPRWTMPWGAHEGRQPRALGRGCPSFRQHPRSSGA